MHVISMPMRRHFIVDQEIYVSSSCLWYTSDSIKVVPKQSEKIEYEREKLAGSGD